jgi:hypothetical protein
VRDTFGVPATAEPRGPQEFLDAITGEVFVAVPRVALLPKPNLSVVFGADFGKRAPEVEVTLALYERRVRKYNPAATFATRRHLGTRYHVWTLGPTQRVCHTFLNSLFVATLDEDALRAVIARHESRRDSLAGSAKYRNIRQHLPAAPALVAYLNVEHITQLLAPLMLASPQAADSLQKLARLQATSLATTIEGAPFRDVGFTAYNTPPPQPAAPTRQLTRALTTPDTQFYLVQPGNWAETYGEILNTIANLNQPVPLAIATRFERNLRRQNIRLQQDVLPQFGPETALIARWRDGARFPDMALAAELRPATNTTARVDAVMDALVDAIGEGQAPAWEAVGPLRVCRIGSGLVAPSYFIADNLFVCASSADYAAELRAQLGRPTLAGNPAYRQLMGRLPTNAVAYTYADLPALARPLCAQIRANFAEKTLPATETLTRHLSPYAAALVAEPLSETTISYSPLGRPATLAGCIAGIFLAVQPHLPPMPALPIPSSSTAPPENPTATSRTPSR